MNWFKKKEKCGFAGCENLKTINTSLDITMPDWYVLNCCDEHYKAFREWRINNVREKADNEFV